MMSSNKDQLEWTHCDYISIDGDVWIEVKTQSGNIWQINCETGDATFVFANHNKKYKSDGTVDGHFTINKETSCMEIIDNGNRFHCLKRSEKYGNKK